MMNLIRKIFPQKKPTKFTINKKTITITPLKFDEVMEVVFIVIPYMKGFIKARKMVADESPVDVYFDVISNIFSQINKDSLTKVFSIILHEPEGFCKELEYKDFIKILPTVLRENKISETFQILLVLGVFE